MNHAKMLTSLEIDYKNVTPSDRSRAWAIAVILNADSIRYALSTFLDRYFSSALLVNILIILVSWTPLINSIVKYHEPPKFYNWAIPIIVFSLFFITLLLDPQSYNSIVLGWDGSYRAFDNVFFPTKGIICFFLVSRMTSSEAMKHMLKIVVITSFLVNVWQPIIMSKLDAVSVVHDVTTGQDYEIEYTAHLGYGLSIVMLYTALHGLLFKKYRFFYFLLSLVCVIEILLYGNRGVFLQLGTLLILFLFNAGGISAGSRMIHNVFVVIIIAIALIVFRYWTEITLAISALGIESRTLESIIEGTMSDSNGREDIMKDVLKLIKENPLGSGVYSSLTAYKFYAHNFFLDILADFGFFLGGALLLLFLIKIIQSFMRFSIQDFLFPFFVCLSFAFGKMMVTNYYMFENYFWVCVAIVVVGLRKCSRTKLVKKTKLSTV